MSKNTISIIGAGAWGTCIAKLLGDKGLPITLWCYEPNIATLINEKQQCDRLPDIRLPKTITATSNLQDAVETGNDVIIALGSAHLPILTQLKAPKNTNVLCLTKGLVSNEDTPFVSDYVQAIFNSSDIAVLSGPNLALEIAQEKPSASVIASTNESLATHFQEILSTAYFRLYRTSDKRGVELGGILKNSIAIAAGISDGFELGNNAKAALITRGLHEIKRIGAFYGAQTDTFNGLSGLGDLIATCNSPLSRNWQFGNSLVTQNITDIPTYIATLPSITEGIRTAQLIKKIAHTNQLNTPIINEVYDIIFNNIPPKKAIEKLMSRELKGEE